MFQTTDFRKGLKIELEGKAYVIIKSEHVNPGKGAAFVKTKLKNMETGAIIEKTFKSGVTTGATAPDMEEREVEYMYADSDGFNFMDQTNYETIHVSHEQAGETKKFLQEGIKLALLYYKGQPISLELPNFVILKVTETDPGLRGDTASGALKKAIVETGHQLNIPLFIKEGELIKIDTRTGEYVERAKSS